MVDTRISLNNESPHQNVKSMLSDTLHPSGITQTRFGLVIELDYFTERDMFLLNIYDGFGMPTGNAYSFKHLVRSHFGLHMLLSENLSKIGFVSGVWFCNI